MKSEKKRIESIDIAKGIGILLVIVGHLVNPKEQAESSIIFAFHMPLFFMLSGVFAASKKSFAQSVKGLLKAVYVPYIAVVIVDAVIHYFIDRASGTPDIHEIVIHTLECAVGVQITYANVAVWFLFALFVIKAVFILINRIKNKAVVNTVVFVIAAGCMAFVLTLKQEEMPKNIIYIAATAGFVFFSLGYFARDVIRSLESTAEKTKLPLVASVPLAALLVFSALENGYVDTRVYNFANPVLYFANAVIGCYVVTVFCAYMANCRGAVLRGVKKVLTFFGENSIVILMVHYPIARKLTKALYEHYGIQDYLFYRSNELVLFIVITLLMVPVIWFFNRFLYFIIGRKNPQKKPSP